MSPSLALQHVCDRVRELYPQLADGLLPNGPDAATLLPQSLWVMEAFLQAGGGARLDQAVDAFASISFDFIVRQARFLRTGRYAATGCAAELAATLYNCPAKMRGYYLDGLLLTYALWPNHGRILQFFRNRFIPYLADTRIVGEVGIGNGLMAATVLSENPPEIYVGVDISAPALEYAAEMVANTPAPERLRSAQLDITDPTTFELFLREPPWDAAICSEVLEHVADPIVLLRALNAALCPQGRAFITTVANLEAEDHVYLYEDENHIRQHLAAADFTVLEELIVPVRAFTASSRPCFNYAAIVVKETGRQRGG